MEPLEIDSLESIGGHAAITPKMPSGPLAITKLVRGPDGQLTTIYVDARTGQELSGLGGYSIWNSQNYLDPEALDKEEESPAEEIIKPKVEPKEIGRGGRDGAGIDTPGLGGRGIAGFSYSPDDSAPSKPTRDRNTETGNYGYINKPTGIGFANMLPGPLGLAAKAVNTGINMNNVSAVNEARNRLGLPDQGLMGRIGGTLKDKKGQVADVTIGDENYSVGFEALSPTGRTNMTPQEAARRAEALKVDITETPKDQVKRDEEAFEKDFGKTGLFADVRNTISSIFDAVNPFDDDQQTKNAFPDAPSAMSETARGGNSGGGSRSYDGKSYSGQNKGLDSPSESGPGPGANLRGGGETGASTSEANRGGRGVTAGGTGLW